jgi:hypothetical protein
MPLSVPKLRGFLGTKTGEMRWKIQDSGVVENRIAARTSLHPAGEALA